MISPQGRSLYRRAAVGAALLCALIAYFVLKMALPEISAGSMIFVVVAAAVLVWLIVSILMFRIPAERPAATDEEMRSYALSTMTHFAVFADDAPDTAVNDFFEQVHSRRQKGEARITSIVRFPRDDGRRVLAFKFSDGEQEANAEKTVRALGGLPGVLRIVKASGHLAVNSDR